MTIDGLYFEVGTDKLGNPIAYSKNVEGYWVNLYMENPMPDHFMRTHMLDHLADNCACVLPEHSCGWCREISRLRRKEEMPYG